MLATLRIKNLALVSDLTLDLRPGFNAITGETGAGKSILIGALKLVLGERADRTLLRAGSDACTVEAVFDVASLRAPLAVFLEENGLEPCEEHQLVLKRTFTAAGSNRQFVNGSPTTLAALKTIGEWLVDIHGPHDHQSLLHAGPQLAILDAFGGLEALRGQFGELVRRRAALEEEKAGLIVDEQTYAQQVDLLRHQVNEIAAARLQPDEEEQVEADYHRASNAARLLQLAQTALGLLTDDEGALLNHAGVLGRTLQELQRIDPAAAPLVQTQEQAVAALQDLQRELSRYADRVDIDPGQLQQLEERLNLLHALKRKFGSTLADVIAFGDDAQRKLQSLESRDAELARLNADLAKLDKELVRLGQELTAQRMKLVPKLCKAVEKQLADLGFKQSHFDIELETGSPLTRPSDTLSPHPMRGEGRVRGVSEPPTVAERSSSTLSRTGFDTVEFQFAPNPGEPPRPLRAIASSGEMARVMLALKTVLAAQDEVPVLIFDEVDANVGGETANAVGEKMRQIGVKRQVLCITHLAPVAAAGDTHFVVTKEIQGDRTLTAIEQLGRKARVTELARMLGGQTDAARRHAEALLKG
jgi:DNA repair protein RecN (Recombination protein N)